jgi:hypothetical protein
MSRMPGAGGKGGEVRHRSGRNWIGGAGEVGSSPTRLSTVAHVERGGAPVRGRRSTLGCGGAQGGGEGGGHSQR